MNLKRTIYISILIFLISNIFSFAKCQTEQTIPSQPEPVKLPDLILPPTLNPPQETTSPVIDPIKKYDDLIAPASPSSSETPTPQPTVENIPVSDLFSLLPSLNDVLYQNWKLSESFIWMSGEPIPDFITLPEHVLNEIGLEEVLKQVYEKDNHKAAILVYKFKSFTGAYSAYTILHRGNKSKLKVGRNATEVESLINFWKGNYYLDIHGATLNDSEAKQFVVLSSQDVSKNIKSEQMPPVVALQLPALNRIQGSEKYCFSIECAKEYLTVIEELDYSVFNIEQSGGIITAKYKLTNDVKDKDEIALLFTRYTEKDMAALVFDSLKAYFQEKAKQNKDLTIDENNSQIKIKYKKNGSISIKQKGNLLGISQSLNDKKSSEKVLDLIPWPVEIEKPLN